MSGKWEFSKYGFGPKSFHKQYDKFLWGEKPKMEKLPTGTEEQMQFGGKDIIGLLQQMMNPGGGLDMANQYDQSLLGTGPEALNNFSAPYLQQFQEQIMPQIAERFAGGGALSSSGFGQALAGGASNLQAQLAQMFSQLQSQASGRQQNQFQNLSNTGLNYSPFDYHEDPGTQGMGPQIIAALVKALAGGM